MNDTMVLEGRNAVQFMGTVSTDKIDRDAGIIRGISAATVGEAVGHYAWCDAVMLEQIAAGIVEDAKGLKARYTHDFTKRLQDHLGHFEGATIRDEQVFTDLHMSPSAKLSPAGDLWEHAFSLAEHDSEHVGFSIEFWRDWRAEELFHVEHLDEDGEFVSPDPRNTRNLRHFRIKRLDAIALVGDPAVNPKGMFSVGEVGGESLTSVARNFAGVVIEEVKSLLGSLKGGVDELGMDDEQEAREEIVMVTGKNELGNDESAETTTVDIGAVQAASRTSGVEEGGTAARGELSVLLAAFPEHRDFAVDCFGKGMDISKAREAHAVVLSEEIAGLKRQLKAGTDLDGAQALESNPADSPAGGVGSGTLLERGKVRAKAEGINVVDAMSRIAYEDPTANAVGEAFKHQVLAASPLPGD